MRRLGALFLVIGAASLVWLIARLGPRAIGADLLRIGWAFGLTCGAHLGGLLLDSVTLRALAGAPGRAVSFGSFVRASLTGHAINEATPLGKLGELTKFAVLCEQLAPERAAAALVAQNVVMFVTNCGLIASAALLVVLRLDAAPATAHGFLLAGASFLGFAAVGLLVLARGLGGWPFWLLARLGVGAARLQRWRERWTVIERDWRAAAHDRRAMATAWGSAVASRLCNVGEAALVLALLGSPHVVAAAVLSLAGAQLAFWLTSFVPFQVGTAEGGSFALFRAAGLDPTLGVMIELCRKVRRVVFVALGVAVLAATALRRHGPAPAIAPLPGAAAREDDRDGA